MQNNFRQNAAIARAEADEATLDNVKERCLRAAAAWIAMAERQERVERARIQNLVRSSTTNPLRSDETDSPEDESAEPVVASQI